MLHGGKKFLVRISQRSLWMQVPHLSTPSPLVQFSLIDMRGKEAKELHMLKATKGTKRKVLAMEKREFIRSFLTPQHGDKAIKKGLCYGCTS